MHIIYIFQYFNTPRQEGITRSYELARYMVKHGHQVTMITSGIHNVEFPLKEGDVSTRYETDGIEVIAVRGGYNSARWGTDLPAWRRMIAFHGFAWAAYNAGKRLSRKPDLVFATHPALMVGLSGSLLKKHFSIPFVFEVRDLWPEALINISVLKNTFVIKYLSLIARKTYYAADHISAASPGIKKGILRYGISDNKVTVITNASDLELFGPHVDGTEEGKRLGLNGRFSAIYFGAHGQANGLEYALDAAAELKRRGRSDIIIILHGSGGTKARLKQRASAEELDNIIFSDPVPSKEQMARIVAACDVCMTIYQANKEVSWSPNKFFDALSAGKPVVVNVPGWLGSTVEENKCGIQTEPTDPLSLADALVRLADNESLCRCFAENSRCLAKNVFARDKQAAKLEAVFNHLFKNSE